MTELIDDNNVAQRIAILSDGQRDCLRLVGQYMSSKQIARILNISPHTVDQRLKRAIVLLGVQSRSEAARLFLYAQTPNYAPAEHSPICGNLVYQGSGLVSILEPNKTDPSPDTESRLGDGEDHELHEVQAPYIVNAPTARTRSPFLSVLVEVNRENGLSARSRIFVMLLLALAAIIGIGALINIAEGLSRLQ